MCLGQKALRISRTPRTTRARLFANDIRIQTGTKTSIGDTTDHSEDDFGGCGWMDVPFVSSPAPREPHDSSLYHSNLNECRVTQTNRRLLLWVVETRKEEEEFASEDEMFQFIATFSPPVHRRHPRMALEWQ